MPAKKATKPLRKAKKLEATKPLSLGGPGSPITRKV